MADYYCDQGAYSSVLGTVPVWGIPQEGDGSNKHASTSSSIGSITLSSVPTSGTQVSVFGALVSITGVVNAASVDAAADALATNINNTSNLVTVGFATGTPRLQNLVYARGPSSGAPSGVCQIMTRVGSATLNVTGITTNLSPTPDVVQFSGGTGGCWGWFYNIAAIGVSNTIAARNYGLWATRPMVWSVALSEFDNIEVRTGRNLVLTTGNVQIGALTTRQTYANFLFDNGTTWVGDSADAKLTIDWQAAGNLVAWSELSQFTTYKCRSLGGLTLRITPTSNANNILGWVGTSGGTWGFTFDKVAMIEQAHGFTSYYSQFQTSLYATRYEFGMTGCLLDFSARQRTNLIQPLFGVRGDNSSTVGNISLVGNDIRFALTGVGAAATTVPLMRAEANGGRYQINLRGNRVTTGSSLDLPMFSLGGFSMGIGSSVVAENNMGIGLPAGAVGVASSITMPDSAFILNDSLSVGGMAHYENCSGYVQWVAGQPTLSSVAPDGTTWSWLAYWTNSSQAITPGRPFRLPASRQQSRLSTGFRTWNLELLLDSVSIDQLPNSAVVELEYVTNGGIPVCERVPIQMITSSAVWGNTGAFPYITWSARRISGITSSFVVQDSMLSVRIVVERSLSGGSTGAFIIDPEATLS